MIKPKLGPNKILVRISEADRDAIFRKEIKTTTGRQLWLIKDVEAPFTHDKFYSQTCNIGRVEAVADDVTNIKVGDSLIMEMNVDADPKNIYEKTDTHKLVVIAANDILHDTSEYIPGRGKSQGAFTYKVGDIKVKSHIIMLIRDGVFIAHRKNIICRKDFKDPEHFGTKIKITQRGNNPQNHLATRYVLVAAESSGLSHGDVVVVPLAHISTLDFGGKLFDWFEDDDVYAKRITEK